MPRKGKAKPRTKAENKKAAVRMRKASNTIKGRTCKWCGVGDGERRFQGYCVECNRCQRQRFRACCVECGGPFYKFRAGCINVSCEEHGNG